MSSLVWQSGGVLPLALKMSQDPVDDVLILYTTVRRLDDDFDGSTAATAGFDVDIAYALESLGSGHSRMMLDRCLYFRICARLKCLATSGRSDFYAPSVVLCEDPVIAGEIASWFRRKSSQTLDECYLRGAISVERLH
ncbi:hypothetical protein A3709_02095 [Halioglobus sp. HI00S01]|nr:hypothetical protein A3709_02095 [Halioglobus sp. HI00S01]